MTWSARSAPARNADSRAAQAGAEGVGVEMKAPRPGPRAGAAIPLAVRLDVVRQGHRGPGSSPGQVLHHPAERELRLHPLIPRIKDPDALERMGTTRAGAADATEEGAD